MSKAKQVAKSLKSVLDYDVTECILDRSSDIQQAIDEVNNYWDYDLYKRKPGPAYTSEGIFQGTDLDMAVFLFALKGRGAVINIPTYKSLRNAKIKEDQILSSKENRHGKLLGIVSNKDSFIFSVSIIDYNVIKTDSAGDPRTFALTNFDGEWYDGWKKLTFLPDVNENKFIHENQILSGNNSITFNNFISPGRWTSFFGKYYFITKALISRLEEESKYYFQIIKKIKEDLNIQTIPTYSTKKDTESKHKVITEKGKSIKIKSFVSEIDLPDNESKYPEYKSTKENYGNLIEKRNNYIYKILPQLRFSTRSTEYVFYKNGNNDRFPAWIKNVKWQEYKIKRTLWDRLILFQPAPGQLGVSIRKRIYEKTETVSEKY